MGRNLGSRLLLDLWIPIISIVLLISGISSVVVSLFVPKIIKDLPNPVLYFIMVLILTVHFLFLSIHKRIKLPFHCIERRSLLGSRRLWIGEICINLIHDTLYQIMYVNMHHFLFLLPYIWRVNDVLLHGGRSNRKGVYRINTSHTQVGTRKL